MTLTPKAINVLANIKKELLASSLTETSPKLAIPSVMITLEKPKKEPERFKSTVRMRHARPANGYQRWKQRNEGWAY